MNKPITLEMTFPENWSEGQKSQLLLSLQEQLKEEVSFVVLSDPEMQSDDLDDPAEVVYRGHGNLFVVGRKCMNYKGEVVDGHHYRVGTQDECLQTIDFQNGPVPIVGNNGVTNEALLAILIHRTEVLNSLFPCEENANAISHMKDALQELELRTKRRIHRGVEGQEVK